MRVTNEGHLEGDFDGWDGDARYTFENGGTWELTQYRYVCQNAYRPRAKVVEEGGTYWPEVDGMNEGVEVRPGVEERIVTEGQLESEFKGWDGGTTFTFTNGQVWQQARYAYRYVYLYRPGAKGLRREGRLLLEVDGVGERLDVSKVR